ncbi:glycosyltransferase family 2 protein [Streptococcus iniae]|uniref:glycosyltransferase family 2 protein n=1 Tax=Streptococcus iniae TaxID=1346 RepID=UPI0008FF3428|nr:glycosyltransferase family 2 protein [Streptococcus iniae]APD31345.1 glycosyl transferase [Streptococcus iniae]
MEKVSVIIPVFNGEKYLEACVNSVCQQSYPSLEILIINDGSSDRSGLIAEQLKAKDKRIKILHKKINEGLGAARNSGINMATGDFIVFVDSDDWIDANHIEDLYTLLQKTNSQVAVTNFTRYFEDENKYEIHLLDDDYYEAIYSPEEWFAFQYGQGHHLSLCFTVPWSKIYKKSLFENVRYYTGRFGEDDRTTWKLYLLADRIAYMHRSSLIYRVNSSSMTQQVALSTVFSAEPVFERLATLTLLGFDVSKEIAAFKWRAQINRDEMLASGDIASYKDLQYKLALIEKYKK